MKHKYGKRVSRWHQWTIYFDGETYYGFLPGESPVSFDSPEWEATSLRELKEFIDCY